MSKLDVSIYVGDVYGVYAPTWNFLERVNCICIINDKNATLESTVESLNHEYLHAILTAILSREESYKANYGLDVLIFREGRLSKDLM